MLLYGYNIVIDSIQAVYSFVNGSMSVFPRYSMATYCRTNTTLIYPTVFSIYSKAINLTSWDNYSDVAVNTSKLLKLIHGTVYNCYYLGTEPRMATWYDRENKTLSVELVLWNIVFNLGYLYTDAKNIFLFFYRDWKTTTFNWSFLTF